MRPLRSCVRTSCTSSQGGPRGQQALEYLVTYGWAFAVVLVIVGALAYFGVLTPSKYLPSTCDFGVQLRCVDYFLQAESDGPGTVMLKFQNAFGEDILISNITTIEGDGSFSVEGGGGTLVIPDGAENANAVVLDLSDSEYYLVGGEKVRIPVLVTFSRNEAGAPLHQIVGEVFAAVEDASS